MEIFEVPDLELSIAERTLDSMAEFQENFSYLATGELLMNIKSMPHSPLEYNAVRGESLRILANRFADV